MSMCASCSAELRPEWKFCVYCGAPVIPGAIRPEAVTVASPALSRAATIGVLVAASLAVAVGAVIIVLLVANALR